MPVGVYSVYGSLGSKLAWRLDENFLHNESHDYKVKVLAEELAYNKSLKQFKMFIIDRPLDPSYKLKASVWCVLYTAELPLKQSTIFDALRVLFASERGQPLDKMAIPTCPFGGSLCTYCPLLVFDRNLGL